MPAILAEYNYRITFRRIYRKLFVILILFAFSLNLLSQVYDIGTNNGQTINTCSGTFYDSGGSGSDYGFNENFTVTFCSGSAAHIKFNFTVLNIGNGDVLYVYDGPNTSSPVLATYAGVITLPPFTLTSTGTCLTFNFVSNGILNRPGWAASITTDPPPPATSAITPSTVEVCGGSTITYSVDSHLGSTYNWTVVNGTPASVIGGGNSLNVTWDMVGGVSGIVQVQETTICGSIGTSDLYVDIYYPTAFIVGASANSYCSGGSVNITLSDSEAGVEYQLKVGGVNDGIAQAGTGSALTWPNKTSGIYTIVASDIATGCSNTMTGSQTITENPLPSSFAVGASANSYCQGSPGVTITLSGSESGVNYQIKKGGIDDGAPVPGTGALLSWPNKLNGVYTVLAINNTTLCTNNMSGSQTITENPLPVVSFTGLNPQYDLSEPASVLIGNPLGGTFSGPGIAGINFTPASAGAGTHTITYTYSDAFCTNFSSQITTVSDYNFKAGAKLLSSAIPWCSSNAQFSTIGATADEIKGTCWANGPNYNRWFKFQATTTDIIVQLKTGGAEGTLQYPFLALFDAANTQLGCATYSSQYSDIEIVYSGLTIGQDYFIAVDNYVGAGYRGTFSLCVDPSVNYDLKAGAVTVPSINNWCSTDAQYTTVGATGDQAKGSCWANGPNYNRWFRFQATSTKTVSVRLKTGGAEGTLQYPFMALWKQDGTQIGCATYTSQYSDIDIMAEGLIENDWYYVSVDNYVGPGYQGTFKLCIDQTVDYDLRAGAISIPSINNWCSADAIYTTVDASADQNKGSCWANGPNYNRWFSFTTTATGTALIQLKTGGAEGTLQYPFMALWQADGTTQVGCATYSSQYSDLTIVAEGLAPSQLYYVSVDNYVGTGYSGTFSLCIDDDINYDLYEGAVTIGSIINWCSPDAAYSTIGATGDKAKGTCWANGPNYNRWFKFQATATTVASIKLKTGGAEGTLQYPFLALWQADGTTQVGCATYTSQYSDIDIVAEGLTNGSWYYISVDNYVGTGYSGTFTLCVDEKVDYDLKAGAIDIPSINNWCSADAAYTTVGASADKNKGSCWANGPNYNRWFSFTTTATGTALIQLKTGGAEGTLQYPFMALWQADGTTQVGCATYSSQYSDLTIVAEGLAPSQLYYVSVDNYVGTGYSGTFSLCIDDDINYDLYEGAVTIGSIINWCSPDAAYSTIGATGDKAKGTCWANGPNYNRWFKFQATATTVASIKLKTGGAEGTLQYPFLALWQADGTTQVGCATYTSQYSDIDIVAEGLTAGIWYYISVDNYVGTGYSGTFTLCVDEKVDYDLFAGAIDIPSINNWCSSNAAYTTIGASADKNKGSCWANGPNYNRWFSFVATTTVASIQLKTGGAEGTLQYPFMALWQADGTTQIACATYTSQYSYLEIVSAALTIGNTYYVSVDNYTGTGYSGTFSLCIDDKLSYNFKDGAITLSDLNGWCSSNALYTTVGATADQAKGTCWTNGPNYNRWFKFQAPATGAISFQVRTTNEEGTLRRPYVALWDASLIQVACKMYTTDNSDIEVTSTTLTPGNWYYLSVDNFTGTGYQGSFTICATSAIPNDNYASAITLTDFNSWCSVDARYTNSIATPDPPVGSCFGGGVNKKNVWFKFTAANPNVTVTVTTGGNYGTMSNQQIAMFDNGNTQLGCTAPIAGQGTSNLIVNGLTTGNTYWISVDDNNISGTFSLCIDDDGTYIYPPGVVELTDLNNWCSPPANYTNVGSPADTKFGSCWGAGIYNNKWFKFQATTSEIKIDIKTGAGYGTMVRQQVALWNSTGGEVACTRWTSNQGTITLQSVVLTPGQWYYVSVDDDNTSGTFSLCINKQVDFDFYQRALSVSTNWCSSDAAYDNTFATADKNQGSCWSGAVNKNVWFKFTAATTYMKVSVKIGGGYGTMVRQQVALWDASGNSEIACTKWVNNQGIITLQTNSLVPTQTYYISVDDDNTSGTFSLCLNDVVDYDYYDGALPVSTNWCSSDAAFDNTFATTDKNQGSCWSGAVNKNVWFKFTATTSFMKISVKTGGGYGTMVRQQVALWDASGTNEIACSKWINNQGTITLQTNSLTPGTYYISVDDDNTPGTFSLCLSDIVDYDYYGGAQTVSTNWCSSDAAYDNTFATADKNQGSCWSGAVNKNVWFKFTATTSFMKISVKTGGGYGTMVRQQVALWDASGTNEIACSKWINNQGTITLQTNSLTPGTYYISVDDDNTPGSFSLCLTDIVDYDFYEGALPMSTNWCSTDAAYDNTFATADKSQGLCWSGATNKNVWFQFTASTPFIKISVKTGGGYGSMVRQQVALWQSDGTTQIGCTKWVTNQGTITLQANNLTPGVYYISVDDDNTPGSFSLCLTDIVDYDYYEGALPVSTNWCSADAAYDNTFATADKSQGLCWSGATNKNVWFQFTASSPFIKISVKTGGGYGSMVRQQVALWQSGGTTQIGCTKWVTNQGTITLQANNLTPGVYYISVDDDNTPGTFSLCLTDIVDYDFKAGALELPANSWCSSDAAYDNIFATADEIQGSCWNGINNKNVWFRFKALTNFARISVKTGGGYGTMIRQQFAVWADPSGVQVGCVKLLSQGTLTLDLNTLTPNNYYWISVDDDNTSGTFSICVNSAPLTVAITSTNVTCFGLNDGTATAVPSGGAPPYSYLWTGPGGFASVSASISNLIPGTYNVKVTDSNGDFVNGTAIITQPVAVLSGSISSQTNISCTGGNNGSVTVLGSGGTPAYQYKIDAGSYQASGTFGSLTAGSYVVTVKDANNCTITVPVTITTIADIISPTITCPLNISQNVDAGVCTASVVTPNPVAADNCAVTLQTWAMTGATTANSPATGINNVGTYTFNSGVTNVTYTVRDAAANSANCSFTITVTDNINPSIICSGPVSVQCLSDIPATYANYAAFTAAGGSATDNCGILTTSFVFVSDVSAGTCPQIISRTYQIADVNGNTSICVQTITVNDTQAPTASNPAPISVQCIANVPAPDITVVTDEADNCSAAPTVAFLSDVNNGGSGCTASPYIVTRTYRVTDACGNIKDVTQTITAIDNTAPTASNPAPISVQCIANVPAPDITVVTDEADNCSAAPTVAFLSDVNNGGSGCTASPYIVTRTYRVTDACGNIKDVTQTITAIDNTAPTASNPAPISVQCIANVPAPDITVVTDEADNCSAAPTVAFLSDVNNGGSGCTASPYIVTRTYRVTDACGNIKDVTQTITAIDNTAPTASNPAPISVQCIANVPAPDITVVTDEADNCSAAPTVAFLSDVNNGGSGCTASPYIVTRTYRVTDACGNIKDVTQTITAIDNTAPTASNPAPISVQCIANVPAPDITVVTDEADNCSAAPTVAFLSDVNNGGSGCTASPYIVTRTYRVTDACGNIKDVTQTITAIDNTAPTASNPAPISVQCIANVPAPDITVVTDEADNCSAAPTVAFLSDVNNGGSGCTASPYIVTRTYRVTDACGNIKDVTQTITAIDNTAPTASNPAPISVQCIANVPAPDITVVTDEADNCSAAPTVAFLSDVNNGGSGCTASPYIVTRTYRVTDACGNIKDVTQTITAIDNTAPTASNPAPISVQCIANVPAPDITVVTDEADNCSAAPTVAFLSDVNNGGSGCTASPYIVTRTYRVTDACGNIKDVTQTITAIDNTAPTASNPAPISVQCIANVPAPDITVVTDEADNCSAAPTVAFLSDVNNGGSGCTASPYIVTRTYRVTDACGNIKDVTQTITAIDNTIPAVSGCPSDITVNNIAGTCGAVVTWTSPAFTDNCGSPVVVSTHNSGDTFPAGTTLVTYTATDLCGNIATCSFNIIVNDSELPTITCPANITQPANAAQTTASVTVPDAVTNDNCSVSVLTWAMTGATSGSSPVSGINQVGVFTFNEGITTVTYTASDAAGNTGTCSFIITILPSALPLSGSITSQTDIACFGTSTGSVTVTGSEGIPPYEYSLNAGTYQSSGTFSTLAAGNFTVTIRDKNLNTFDIAVSLSQPASSVSGTITAQVNNICSGANSGSITVSGSGGVSPYRYKLGSGSYQTSGTFGSLITGSYTLTVQDANLCILDMQVTITEPSPITPTVTSQTNISCSGASDGSVTITATGGTSPYEYNIDGGAYQSSGTFSNLTPGAHSITIRDANLCTSTATASVTEPVLMNLSLTSTEASCPDEPDGSITLAVSGGTQPYSYIWDDGTTTGDRTNVPDGSYSVVVKDANGCAASANIEVGVVGSSECIVIQELITPNNDGFNDTWKIRNIDLFPDAEVLVYNRWGKLVFKTKNISANEWDGTSDGKLLPTDSYHYILHLDGSKTKSGVVSIIR